MYVNYLCSFTFSELSITNPRCCFCSRVIEQKLVKMSGIKDVAVSYLTDTVIVQYDPEKMMTGMIRESISHACSTSIYASRGDMNLPQTS